MIWGIVDLVDNISGLNCYSMIAPQEIQKPPYVVVSLDGVEPTPTKDANKNVDYVTASVMLYYQGSYLDAHTQADAIRTALNRQSSSAGSITTDSIEFINRFDEVIDSEGYEYTYIITQEFRARVVY